MLLQSTTNSSTTNQSHTKWFRLCLLLLLALILAVLALFADTDLAVAQGGQAPAYSDSYWHAEYWDNKYLSGEPMLVRNESILDYNWEDDSPDPRIPADYFSARWSRYLNVPWGVYRFTAASDDGIRVFVDDRLIIDHWYEHPRETYTADIELGTGHHLITVEYFEQEGVAEVYLSWQPVEEIGTGPWRGEYYDNRDLYGQPRFVQYSNVIDFNWGNGSPRTGTIDKDNFSIRWTRTARFAAGHYRFRITVDDGARLWVDDHLLIDSWRDQPATSFAADIYLSGGNIPIRLEFYEHEGAARVHLDWEALDPGGHPGPKDAWRGEYFNNDNLRGRPDWVRDDETIRFNWRSGAPAPHIDDDYFSVRWTRTLYFDKGRYRFTTETDDGLRLYVDGRLIIDKWERMSRTEHSATRTLSRGYHTVRMEYFEATGDAYARLRWKQVDEEEEEERRPVGNIITCVPPQPSHCAWIKIYRLEADNTWLDVSPRGFASCVATGYLKIDGLQVDTDRYGDAGHPYRVEQWIDGQRTQSTGNFQEGEPVFLVRPNADNYTPWQCTPS